MKRVALFVVLAVVVDFALGAALGRLFRRTMTGANGGLTNYALTRDAEVLVLGSSRAQYHVMPRVVREELGLSAYNAGLRGHDLLYSLMLYDLWKRRHPNPRAVVVHVDIESLLRRENELGAVQILAPYLDESPLVREVLYEGSPFKRLAYLSRAYRYNGKVLPIFKNLFQQPPPGFDGFLVAEGVIDLGDPRRERNALDQDQAAVVQAEKEFWEPKVQYLRALAEESARQGTRLVLLHTPIYEQDARAHQIWMARLQKLLATIPGVELIDICEATHPEVFVGHPELYFNTNHLNGKGATVFSRMFARELGQRLGRSAASAP
jgi:hypothetical protein